MAGANDPRRGEENKEENLDDLVTPENGQQLNGIDHSDSDDNESQDGDSETSNGGGYALLPQDAPPEAAENENNDDTSQEEDEFQTLGDILQRLPPSVQVENMIEESQRTREIEQVREREVLFATQASHSADTIDMNKDRVETIRSAMSGFQLPPGAIPSWAADLSDEQWRQMISDKLSVQPKK